MFKRCQCKTGVKIIETTTNLDLYFLGEHDETSHDVDKSKYLKHKQIVAVHEGARICPQGLSLSLRSAPEPGGGSRDQSGETN
jgi:hypothetical protein